MKRDAHQETHSETIPDNDSYGPRDRRLRIERFRQEANAWPAGGKLLENEPPRAEFIVITDHSVTITFYDEKLVPAPVTDQVVTATAEAADSKTKLEFEKKGDVLVSKAPLLHGMVTTSSSR